MFEHLKIYMKEKFQFDDEQLEQFRDVFVPQFVERGNSILVQGDICKYGAFVTQGCLRSFVIDSKGREHIIQFAPENWWIAEQLSMARQQPAMYNIDAIEDTHYLAFTNEYYNRLSSLTPHAKDMFNTLFMNSFHAMQKRLISHLSATGEERYVDFNKTYSMLATRIPQKMIASYLGITPETLSRIRKELVRK